MTELPFQTAQTETWPPLIPFAKPSAPQVPLHVLPDHVRGYAESVAASLEIPPGAVMTYLLATISTACARRFRVEIRPEWTETVNLWLLLVLPSGTRKSAVLKAMYQPILDWEWQAQRDSATAIRQAEVRNENLTQIIHGKRKQLMRERNANEIAAIEQEIEKLEEEREVVPAKPRLVTNDATPEKLALMMSAQGGCIAWLSDEGGLFDIAKGRYSQQSNLDVFLQSYDGSRICADRLNRESVRVSDARLTIGIGMQPKMLEKITHSDALMDRGLMFRFLFVLPESNLGRRTHQTDSVPQAERQQWNNLIEELLSIEPAEEGDHMLRLSSDARDLLLQYQRGIEPKMGVNGCFADYSGWASKLIGKVVRIAALFHCIEYGKRATEKRTISSEHIAAAIALGEVFEQHALAAMETLGIDEKNAKAIRLVDRLKRSETSLSERDILRKNTWLKDMNSCRSIVQILAERGYVKVIKPDKQQSGRPKSSLVMLNPEVTERRG